MSYSVDVNILLCASDRSSEQYQAANRFLARCAAGPEILCLAWAVLISYMRISTHPRIFDAPLAPDEAAGNVTSLRALPHVRTVAEQDGFLDAYRHVTASQVVRGNLVPDAQLAAILFQHGVRTLYTRIAISAGSSISTCVILSPRDMFHGSRPNFSFHADMATSAASIYRHGRQRRGCGKYPAASVTR
jgi:toxin-antitoxin system PIN domain toxin